MSELHSLSVVSKGEFARLVEISPSRVTALLAEGLPVDDAGRVPVPDALAWLAGRTPKVVSVRHGAENTLQERARRLLAARQALLAFDEDALAARRALVMRDAVVRRFVQPDWLRWLARRVIAAGGDAVTAFAAVEAVTAWAGASFPSSDELPEREEWVSAIVEATGVEWDFAEWDAELARRCGPEAA